MGNCLCGELSEWGIVQWGIVLVGNCPVGNCPFTVTPIVHVTPIVILRVFVKNNVHKHF